MYHLLLASKNQSIISTTGNPNVAMLLAGESSPSLSSGLSNLIGDTSNNALTTTSTGSPAVGTFSPYGSNWNTYFNGSSALEYSTSSSMSFGTSDFTFEFWMFAPSAVGTSTEVVIDTRTTSTSTAWGLGINVLGTNPGEIGMFVQASAIIQGGVPTVNAWNHIALVRHSGTTTIYLNGVSQSSVTDTTNYSAGTTTYIGRGYAGNYLLTGNLSNLRVVNGTAVYTANFTPPTSPLTNVTNTKLLICGTNNFNDSSSNAYAPTIVGTPVVTRFSPFTTGYPTSHSPSVSGTSVYLNGSSYLTAAATSAESAGSESFTIEFYMYLTSLPASGSANSYYTTQKGSAASTANFEYGIYILNSSGSYCIQLETSTTGSGASSYNSNNVNLTANSWNHVAVTKTGTTAYFWFNGQSAGSQTVPSSFFTGAGSFYVGSNAAGSTPMFPGYIADVRYVNGSTVYTAAFTPPTSPLTAISGTQFLLGSQKTAQNFCEVYDASGENNMYVSSATISNTESKFNGTSYYFNGSSYMLSSTPSLNFGFQNNFTVEFWFYQTGATSTTSATVFLDARSSSNTSTWACGLNIAGSATPTGLGWSGGATPVINSSTIPSLNTWHHAAFVRNNGTLTVYLDGTNVGTTTNTTSYTSTDLYVGNAYSLPSSDYFKGYMSDIRISESAVYNANFTPPTNSFVGQ
jgi:hypothetical protein